MSSLAEIASDSNFEEKDTDWYKYGHSTGFFNLWWENKAAKWILEQLIVTMAMKENIRLLQDCFKSD